MPTYLSRYICCATVCLSPASLRALWFRPCTIEVKRLLDQGEDASAKCWTEWTPLLAAVHRRMPEAVELFLDSGAPPTTDDVLNAAKGDAEDAVHILAMLLAAGGQHPQGVFSINTSKFVSLHRTHMATIADLRTQLADRQALRDVHEAIVGIAKASIESRDANMIR